MNRFDKGHTYVIKPCAVGYGVYDELYWLEYKKCGGLYMTARTKEECIEKVVSSRATYRLED